MSNVAVQISFTLDNASKRIWLDNVNATSLSLSSTITTHPVLNGDMISDHMYKNPPTMSVSGEYSLNGNTKISGVSSLSSFQTLFERIKNEGVLCTIVKTASGESGSRFLSRTNMVLDSISWTEKINSLQFSFGFTQVLMATVQVYDVDLTDEWLPNITGLNIVNFTDALIDWKMVDALMLDDMLHVGIITEDFLTRFWESTFFYDASQVFTAQSVQEAIGILWGAAWKHGNEQLGFVKVLKPFFEEVTRLLDVYHIETQFILYQTDAENREAQAEFVEFFGEIHNALYLLNNEFQCYQVGGSGEQECTAFIDNEYYSFRFKKNNTNGKYSLEVANMDGAQKAYLSDVSTVEESIYDCRSDKALFRTSTGVYVFLVRTPDVSASDLTNYYVVGTAQKPEQCKDKIIQLIKEAVKR